MKWISKQKKRLRQGDIRTIKRFALLPKRIDSNQIIWLEWYYENQEYQQACIIGTMTFPPYWEKTERYQTC